MVGITGDYDVPMLHRIGNGVKARVAHDAAVKIRNDKSENSRHTPDTVANGVKVLANVVAIRIIETETFNDFPETACYIGRSSGRVLRFGRSRCD